MATQQEELLFRVRASVSEAQKALGQLQRDVGNTGKKFEGLKTAVSTAAKGVGIAVGAAATGIGALVKVGSEYNGQVQQTEFLMGRLDSTTQQLINSKAKEASQLALTSKQYTDAGTQIGTFAKSMGISTTEANKLIPQIVQLAADGAAFANIPMSEAMDAISSAAMGNYEAVGKLNIEMSDALINNSTYAKQLGKTTQQMTTAEKTQAIYNTMLERGAHVSGFAAMEAGSFAAQSQLMKTKIFETAGAIGEQLLPLMIPLLEKIQALADSLFIGATRFRETYEATGSFTEGLQQALNAMGLEGWANFVQKLQDMGEWLGTVKDKIVEYQDAIVVAGIAVGTLVVALGAYWVAQNASLISTGLGVAAITAWNTVSTIGAAVTTAFGAAVSFLTSPITLTILAIGALIAVGYLLIKHWDEVKIAAQNTWQAVCNAFHNAGVWIKSVVYDMVTKVNADWIALKTTVTEIAGGLCDWVSAKFRWLKAMIKGDTEGMKQATEDSHKAMERIVKGATGEAADAAVENYTKMREAAKTESVGTYRAWDEGFKSLDTSAKSSSTNVSKSQEDMGKGAQKASKEANKAMDDMMKKQDEVPKATSKMANSAKTEVNKMAGDFKTAGANAGQGAVNGINSKQGAVAAAAANLGRAATNAFKNNLDIHSPSRVFKELGGFVGEGLAIGIDAEQANVSSSVGSMADSLKSNFVKSYDRSHAGGVGSSSTSTVINLNGSYMFEDRDSMDYFLNRMALAINRG